MKHIHSVQHQKKNKMLFRLKNFTIKKISAIKKFACCAVVEGQVGDFCQTIPHTACEAHCQGYSVESSDFSHLPVCCIVGIVWGEWKKK